MEVKNKRVLVGGIGRSGLAAARLLKGEGALVTLQDIKEEAKLGDVAQNLVQEGFELYLGRNPIDIVQSFDILVLSPGISINLPFVERAASLGVEVIGEMELAYSFARCNVLAITGTNGKTTTTSLVGEIMRLKKPKTAIVGNIGIAFSEHVKQLGDEEWAVAEVSSFQLESIKSFKPRVSAVLNISPDHLNRHKTMETYVATKERIFENQTSEDFLVLNYDDETCRKMASRSKARIVYFSRTQELDEGVFVQKGIITARIGEEITVLKISDMKIIGGHNVENALAATAICMSAGVSVDVIAKGLREFRGVEHRLELVASVQGVEYFNDSKATNVDSAIKSLEAMSRPVVLIGGGSDKASDFSDWVKMFSGRVKHLVVMGEVAERICDTCKAHNFSDFTMVNSMKEAVDVAFGRAKGGEAVLLSPACASFDMFDDFEQRGKIFKQYVKQL